MSVISSTFFLIFLLCFSLHACEARYIGFGNQGFDAPYRHSDQGVLLVGEKFRLGVDSNKVTKKEDAATEKGHGGGITSTTQDAMDSKTTASVKELKDASRGQKSGSEILEYSSSSSGQMHVLKATSTTSSKKERRRRVMSADKEAVDDSNSTHDKEDEDQNAVYYPDYNPPHQTPPIHNRKT